jgi:hypothetical protein
MAEIIMVARAGAESAQSRKDHWAKQIFARVGFGFFTPIP